MSDLRETQTLQGKPVLILGLGLFGGGLGAARFCAQQGAKVTVSDLKSESELAPSLKQLEGLPIRYKLGSHEGLPFGKFHMVVVNPAVPKDSPAVQQAEAQGAYLTSEMNLFMARCPGKVVGVTGSNGKSTTTALIAHLLQGSDRRVWLGGNMGVSLLEQVHEIGERDAVVLEFSSFLLEDLHCIQVSPTVAVLLNITPNHLDRHGSMEAYTWAKSAIFRYQRSREITILNYDDPRASLLQGDVPSRLALYSLKKKIQPGGWVERGEYRMDLGKEAKRVASVSACPLPGAYNRSNALAAILAAAVMRTPPSEIERLLPTFPGLEHRLESCGERDGVTFYNDSVSTTPESSIASASAFPGQRLWLIAGGADKQLAYYELAEALTESNVAGVIGFGEIGGRMVEECRHQPDLASLPLIAVPDLAQALETLRPLAKPGEVVLFSPATASYDQYANFEQRGYHFKELIEGWTRDESGAAAVVDDGAGDFLATGAPFEDQAFGDHGFGDDPFGADAPAAPFIQDPLADDPEALASQEEFEAMPSDAPADFAVETPDFGTSEPTGWSDSGNAGRFAPFDDGMPFEEAFGGTQHSQGGAQMSDAGLEMKAMRPPSGGEEGGSTAGFPTDWAAQSFPEPGASDVADWPASPTEEEGSWAEPVDAQAWSGEPALPSDDPVAVPDFGVWDEEGADPWAGDQWVETETGSKPGSKPGNKAAAGESTTPAAAIDDDTFGDNTFGGGLFSDSLNLIEPMESNLEPGEVGNAGFGEEVAPQDPFLPAQNPDEDSDING